MRVPAFSQSATFSSTSVCVPIGETTSTGKSGESGQYYWGMPVAGILSRLTDRFRIGGDQETGFYHQNYSKVR
ncbi:MAG: hypothetical protein QF619_12830 [Candidatus Binatia bacterium]|nr:hypothetical protein [Candidatus Binatia bacterium]